MGAVRDHVFEERTKPGLATGYVRISAILHPHSANRQKAAIHRYTETQRLYISFIRSEQRQDQPR